MSTCARVVVMHSPRISRGRVSVIARSSVVLSAAIFVLASTCPLARGDAAESRAEAIARRAVRADGWSWEGARTRLKMILVEADGGRKERSAEVTARRVAGRRQTLWRFSAPPELGGTALLMLEQPAGTLDAYLYVWTLKRTQRLNARALAGSFLGSDLTFADLQPNLLAGATHARLPDEALEKDACYVIESTLPAGDAAPYGTLATWVRKADFVALRTRFFDRAGKLLKTLTVTRTRELSGELSVAEARVQSENGHATELAIESVEPAPELDDAAFTVSALERM